MPISRPTPSPRARHAAAPQRDAGALAAGAFRAATVPLVIAAVATASAPGWTSYRVQPGDTLSVLAKRSGSTVGDLVRANGLPGHGRYVQAGTVIRVPAGRAAAATRTARPVLHRVAAGESLWSIARARRTTVRALVAANNLRSSLIHPGTVLRVGSTTAAAPATASRAARSSYAPEVSSSPTANRAALARLGVPSRPHMRDEIARTARAYGVDPALALAVSWQETGFQHGKVSGDNAIGAMQVLPETGEWLSGLVGRHLDLLNPRDNATAGAAFLRYLLREAGSPELAVAGYYQGLTSVRTRGMYEDTKSYVRNVMALRARFS